MSAIQIIETKYRERVQWLNAKNRILLQGMSMCRHIVAPDKPFDVTYTAKQLRDAAALYAAVENSEPHDLATVPVIALLMPMIEAQAPLVASLKVCEKEIIKAVKSLPVYPFWKAIRGAGELSLGCIVGELGDLSLYEKKVHGIWKRMGLAVVDGERQRKCSDAEKAMIHGYAPKRRAVMWTVGGCVIGGMSNGYRPFVGEDISLRTDLTRYERLFMERLRVEGAKDPAAHVKKPVECKKTGRLKESYSKAAAARAKRYVEKRLLRDLYRAWVGQPLDDAWLTPEQELKLAA